MSDYTPTTKGVTAYYCHARQEETGVTVDEGAHERFHAEFNHWLAEVKAEAWEEGYAAAPMGGRPRQENPYREEESGDA